MMTVKRLVCACYNVFPGKTELKIVSNLGKNLYTGLWNDGFRDRPDQNEWCRNGHDGMGYPGNKRARPCW